MSLLGVGVDIIHLPRMAALIARRGPHRVARRILSPEEVDQWRFESLTQDPIRFFAVRFSVKEAAYKALYPTAKPTWRELTYSSSKDVKRVKPELKFHPSSRTTDGARIGQLHVTVSHDGEYVVTTVIAERPVPSPGR